MSGGGGFIGDVVGAVTKPIEKALGYGGELIEKTVGTVSDLADDIDIKDAAITYITTGNPYAAAFAATDYDEELGFNPASFYNPATGSLGFADPNVVGGDMPGINTQVFDTAASFAINRLADYAKKSPEQAPQYAQTGQRVLESMSGILADVAAGKYSKSPASEYNTRSVLDAYSNQNMNSSLSAGLLNDYNTAKQKVANMVETPSSQFGELAMQGNPFYNFMQQRNIGKAQEAASNIFQNYVANMPQSETPQQNIFDPYLQEKGIV